MAKRKVLPRPEEEALFYEHRDAYFEFRAKEMGCSRRHGKRAAAMEYAPYVGMFMKGISQIQETASNLSVFN